SFVRTAGEPEGAPHVVFKAELGAVTPLVAQVQGVWVDSRYRGQGLAAPGMAAVVRLAREAHGDGAAGLSPPVVSLYVNDYNARALATYRRVGFEQVGTYATVLFLVRRPRPASLEQARHPAVGEDLPARLARRAVLQAAVGEA